MSRRFRPSRTSRFAYFASGESLSAHADHEGPHHAFYRITHSGVKPIQVQRPGYQNFYLYGAIEPTTGERFLLERDALNSEGFQDFLDGFSHRFPQSMNVLILDNGRFHKANTLTIPENIRLIFLPPYSPELNPIERFWEDVKDHLAFHLHETLSALRQRVQEKLRSYTDKAVAPLTGYQYLVDAANAQPS